jgi:transcriptional regulator with XRE-family HTH domain
MIVEEGTLSSRLREARKKKGYSQADLAKIIKTSTIQVGRYERGAEPTATLLSSIAYALDVTTDYLVRGETYKNRIQGSDDIEFVQRYERVSKLPQQQKDVILKVLDAFLEQNFLRESLNQIKLSSK